MPPSPTWSPLISQEKWSGSRSGRNFYKAWGQTSVHGRGKTPELRGMPNESCANVMPRPDLVDAAASHVAMAGDELGRVRRDPPRAPVTCSRFGSASPTGSGRVSSRRANATASVVAPSAFLVTCQDRMQTVHALRSAPYSERVVVSVPLAITPVVDRGDASYERPRVPRSMR